MFGLWTIYFSCSHINRQHSAGKLPDVDHINVLRIFAIMFISITLVIPKDLKGSNRTKKNNTQTQSSIENWCWGAYAFDISVWCLSHIAKPSPRRSHTARFFPLGYCSVCTVIVLVWVGVTEVTMHPMGRGIRPPPSPTKVTTSYNITWEIWNEDTQHTTDG